MKVGKYVDANNDILHIVKVCGESVMYYCEYSDGRLYPGFTRKGILLEWSNFSVEDMKRVDFNAYLEKL